MLALLRLLRPEQWYKNLIVFLGLIFSQELFFQNFILRTFIAFVILCIYSGVNYTINDIVDAEKDKRHPEKSQRPIPSGKVSKGQAAAFTLLLLSIAVYTSFSLSYLFGLVSLLFFFVGITYTFFLKNLYLVDVITIGANFSLRAVLGVLVIDVFLSPWLVICTFLLALFLALGKRKSELAFLGKTAKKHRKVLESYNNPATDYLIIATLSALFISYSIYSVIAKANTYMILTIPIATFLLFRYMSFVFTQSKISRNAEKVFTDKPMLFGISVWVILAYMILYVFV